MAQEYIEHSKLRDRDYMKAEIQSLETIHLMAVSVYSLPKARQFKIYLIKSSTRTTQHFKQEKQIFVK